MIAAWAWWYVSEPHRHEPTYPLFFPPSDSIPAAFLTSILLPSQSIKYRRLTRYNFISLRVKYCCQDLVPAWRNIFVDREVFEFSWRAHFHSVPRQFSPDNVSNILLPQDSGEIPLCSCTSTKKLRPRPNTSFTSLSYAALVRTAQHCCMIYNTNPI
jgi:hypothetical protein